MSKNNYLLSKCTPFVIGIFFVFFFSATVSAKEVPTNYAGLFVQENSTKKIYYVKQDKKYRIEIKTYKDALFMSESISQKNLSSVPFSNYGLDEGGVDSDEDGISDAVEEIIGSDPYSQDTDGDGYLDQDELIHEYSLFGKDKVHYDIKNINAKSGNLFSISGFPQFVFYVHPIQKKVFVISSENFYDFLSQYSVKEKKQDLKKIRELKISLPQIEFTSSKVSVQAGESVLLSWKTKNAVGCKAEGSPQWKGSKRVFGSERVRINDELTLYLTCWSKNGVRFSVTKKVSISLLQKDSTQESLSQDVVVQKNEEVPPAQSTPPAQQKQEQQEQFGCIAVYDPVCGIDGKTYSNACFAKIQKTDIASKGECKAVPPPIQKEPIQKPEQSIQTPAQTSQQPIAVAPPSEKQQQLTTPTPIEIPKEPDVLTPKVISCDVPVEQFKKTGEITCGHIAWRLLPQEASLFEGDPRLALMKYDELYLFYKDFMAGHEPNGNKVTIQENPENPYPADADWQDSVIHTNTDFVKDHIVYVANMKSHPFSPSFMHEFGHIFGLSAKEHNAYIWKEYVEANANMIGIIPYLMAYDGKLNLASDFWCREKLKKEWPCDATFSQFENYPEWLGANKDLAQYDQDKETFSTLFINPPQDQNTYERGGKFQTMITTLYSEFKKKGQDREFYQAYKKTQEFYAKKSDLFPVTWLSNDSYSDLSQDTILKANTYLFLMSAYAKTDLLASFENRWRVPILQKTKDAFSDLSNHAFQDESITNAVKKLFE